MVTIKPEDTEISGEDSQMGIVPGERISVGDLLKGLLIPSGDDAALALARYTDGSVESFVTRMNKRASSLGLMNTHFVNPSGLDEAGHNSTASDLSQLAKLLVSDPVLKDIVGTRYTTVTSANGHVYALYNTNTLLGQDGITGIKTGHTNEAGDCLISLETINGHEIITTLLGSSDRFGETESLINWSRQNISW
jgi:serine-type D-Ala-D-Ala carboxypeptidase (penicillin-binding protein 5/6)